MTEEEKKESEAQKKSEEKSSEKPQEKKAEAKPKSEEKVEPKSEEKPKEHHAKERKKISRMKLSEVETELKVLQGKMGGFQSNFAQHLLARKKELLESSKSSV